MSTSITGFGRSTPATNVLLSQVEGAQPPSGGPQPPPATLPAAIADSHLSGDTYSQSQAATALLATTAPSPTATSNEPQAIPAATPSVSAPAVSGQTTTTQAQNPTTSVVAGDTTSDTNYVQQFEQAEAPPPYTLATSAPNPARENRTALAPVEFSPFQIRQFSDLIKTIHGITAAVLPQFSYSA